MWARAQFQIFRGVILSVGVFVVNFFGRKQWAPKNARHDVPVLEDVFPIDAHPHVTLSRDGSATLPVCGIRAQPAR